MGVQLELKQTGGVGKSLVKWSLKGGDLVLCFLPRRIVVILISLAFLRRASAVVSSSFRRRELRVCSFVEIINLFLSLPLLLLCRVFAFDNHFWNKSAVVLHVAIDGGNFWYKFAQQRLGVVLHGGIDGGNRRGRIIH